MNIELKDFQDTAVRELLKYIRHAREEARDGIAQAIVLSAPTGSGKTVMITALMESIYQGHEITMGDPDAIFLWLSDSPELNQQSRAKILQQSNVFQESNLIVVEPPFSQEYFEAGKVYFLNTQKLAKDSRLTDTGDGREYSIWQTIQNTAQVKSDHFYVIIDEAHRGMRQNNREVIPIMQRFIKGYSEAGLEPVRLIIGMSATPERFNKIIEGSDRIKRPWTIKPQDVKGFGLLKEKIILFHPESSQPADWAMLEEATRRWQRFCDEWEKYCSAQKMEQIVKPVLVIQVEDGNNHNSVLTRTNLDKLVQIVERNTGVLPEDAWVHTFEDVRIVEGGGRRIRKIEASRIQEESAVRVVLFKMSLSTGWDCPRAEVMMSFRRANDPTFIAQLVGRMIRTPLARGIEGQEFLNTVALYLPHFDSDGLNRIIDELNNPDSETYSGVEFEDGAKLVESVRNPLKAELFSKLEGLPTYCVERMAKALNPQRLMKLARRLTSFDELDLNALGEAKALISETLSSELIRLRENSDFIHNITENEEIEIQEVMVEYGEWKLPETSKTFKIKTTPENIEDLFIQCGRRLGDEGLHMDFWKAQQDKEKPLKAKLELFGILQDKAAREKLEQVCEEKIQQLFKKHHCAIEKLPSSKKEYYRRIKRTAKHPENEPLCLPQNFEMKMAGEEFRDHLFINSTGKFSAKLNNWETPVLKRELARPEVIGWLRNLPRKEWSLCVPYKMGGDDKPLFPDFVIFRELEGRIVVDILDPHSTHLPDAVPKAKGLAEYARQHGDHYERIEFIIINSNGEIKRLDLNNESIREKVLRVESKAHLEQLFEDWG